MVRPLDYVLTLLAESHWLQFYKPKPTNTIGLIALERDSRQYFQAWLSSLQSSFKRYHTNAVSVNGGRQRCLSM